MQEEHCSRKIQPSILNITGVYTMGHWLQWPPTLSDWGLSEWDGGICRNYYNCHCQEQNRVKLSRKWGKYNYIINFILFWEIKYLLWVQPVGIVPPETWNSVSLHMHVYISTKLDILIGSQNNILQCGCPTRGRGIDSDSGLLLERAFSMRLGQAGNLLIDQTRAPKPIENTQAYYTIQKIEKCTPEFFLSVLYFFFFHVFQLVSCTKRNRRTKLCSPLLFLFICLTYNFVWSSLIWDNPIVTASYYIPARNTCTLLYLGAQMYFFPRLYYYILHKYFSD